MNAYFFTQYAEDARSILLKHFHEKITVADIAEMVGVGERTLKRAFKSRFQVGIHEFQVKLRMDKAKELLKQGTKSVKQVARQVGYKRQSNFTRRFIDYFGILPSECIGKNGVEA
jgi:AraC-like DNA-binding protein